MDDEDTLPPIAVLAPTPSSPPQEPAPSHRTPLSRSGDQLAVPRSAHTKKQRERFSAAGERAKGTTSLPQQRVEKIVKESHGSASPSKEALFVLTAATEEFIQQLSLLGHEQAVKNVRHLVTVKDIAIAVSESPALNKLLEETIPIPITVGEALTRAADSHQAYLSDLVEEGCRSKGVSTPILPSHIRGYDEGGKSTRTNSPKAFSTHGSSSDVEYYNKSYDENANTPASSYTPAASGTTSESSTPSRRNYSLSDDRSSTRGERIAPRKSLLANGIGQSSEDRRTPPVRLVIPSEIFRKSRTLQQQAGRTIYSKDAKGQS